MPTSDLVRMLLFGRGITSDADIASFLAPDYAQHTHDPFLLQGMEAATQRVFHAIEGGERIAVYADFDCDGIPGAALLSDFFNKIGYENFETYIPHRDREGYGFHIEAIESLAKEGVKLIITVDVGTNAAASVAFAKKNGIDVIVTDHHEVSQGEKLPKAVAVLNPKCGEYPFRDICGAAVAFKLVQALLIEGRRRALKNVSAIPQGWEKWLLDLVGIATIADMVPLVGENRVLARFGLTVLRKSLRPGIRALCRVQRLRQEEITEDDIGFSIAPRINAASRMGEPEAAFRLLTTSDPMEADRIAKHLEELNASRRGVVSAMVRQARRNVAARFASDQKVVVVGNPEWKPSLCGLAANSIMGERGGVACVWGRDAQGRIKGSCRSDGSISLVELFGAARELFVEAGGHEKSGGFSVSHERIHTLADDLLRIAKDLDGREVASRTGSHDARLALPEITRHLFGEVSRLAPFGVGNPKPVFLITGVSVASVRRFGRDNNHVEVQLSCVQSGTQARAFDFFRSPEDFSLAPAIGANAEVLATIERDSYRGGLALRLVDIQPLAGKARFDTVGE